MKVLAEIVVGKGLDAEIGRFGNLAVALRFLIVIVKLWQMAFGQG